jgi:hypothetical protein
MNKAKFNPGDWVYRITENWTDRNEYRIDGVIGTALENGRYHLTYDLSCRAPGFSLDFKDVEENKIEHLTKDFKFPKFEVGDIVKVLYDKNEKAYKIRAIKPCTKIDGTPSYEYRIDFEIWEFEHFLEFYFEMDKKDDSEV